VDNWYSHTERARTNHGLGSRKLLAIDQEGECVSGFVKAETKEYDCRCFWN